MLKNILTVYSRSCYKDQFYSDLDCIMTTANGLTMVMGNFNAAIGEAVQGVVGCHGLAKRTSDKGKRLVSFASMHVCA